MGVASAKMDSRLHGNDKSGVSCPGLGTLFDITILGLHNLLSLDIIIETTGLTDMAPTFLFLLRPVGIPPGRPFIHPAIKMG